ncbi:MAG: S8 family serine peptidase [Flavobacterium sp.]|nr:S8 family serine peptidase [Flavobacterium sp.]
MKNRITKLIVLALVLGGSFSIHAQTDAQRREITKNYNKERARQLAAKFEREFYEKKAEAYRLAEINNWPLEIRENGKVAKLMSISKEGVPLYYTTYNTGSAITSRSNHLKEGGSLGLNLTGAGMYVGVWDEDYPRVSHVEFVNRFTTQDGPANPQSAHSTHVLGTIIGAGVDPNARGIAHQAFGYINDFNNDLGEMSIQAEYGLLLSNHSYGYRANMIPEYYFGAYTEKSQGLDAIAYEFDSYQAVLAAGNDGDGNFNHLTGMGTAKNGIVVAAISEVPNYTGPSSVNLAGFSNWGPTDDNRIKPDIASKGVGVFSATSTSNTAYGSMNGTSMAAPGVTGALVLVQEHYSNVNNGEFMLSATVRGLLAHTADEAGAFDGPDSKFGWGLINAKKMAEAITNDGTTSIIDERVLSQGGTYSITVSSLGTEPLMATLSWTDPAAGTTSGSTAPRLINNLDIKITKDGQTFYPWKLNNSLSGAAIRGENNVDNIEKVEVNNPTGNYVITISHKGNLTNPLNIPSQKYSLIVTGIDAESMSVGDANVSAFNVWPNPSNTSLNISLVTELDGAMAQIFDVQGRMVIERKLDGIDTTFDVSQLNAGFYVVRVSGKGFSETKKIIINN